MTACIHGIALATARIEDAVVSGASLFLLVKLSRSVVIMLALMTYRQIQRHIGSFVIAVKRQISGLAARNDLFAQTL